MGPKDYGAHHTKKSAVNQLHKKHKIKYLSSNSNSHRNASVEGEKVMGKGYSKENLNVYCILLGFGKCWESSVLQIYGV